VENDPSIDPSFFIFDVKKIETHKQIYGSGEVLFIVDNKRDFPRYDWLIGSIVTLDGKQFRCTNVLYNIQAISTRVGEEIGLTVKELE